MQERSMPVSEARVATAMAQRYLTQLCKHFQHKLPVTLAEGRGQIGFSGGVCSLEVEDGALVMRLAAEDAAALERLEEVVSRHLARFAFREPPEVRWSRAA